MPFLLIRVLAALVLGAYRDPRPETALWDALVDADPEGVSIAELEAACGMGRRWVYYRLQAHATADRAVQVRRGCWRAVRPSDGPPEGDGQ